MGQSPSIPYPYQYKEAMMRMNILLKPLTYAYGLSIPVLSLFFPFIADSALHAQNTTVAYEIRYDEVKNFHNGLAAVKIGNKWGFINKTGQVVIDPQFDMVSSFYEGVAAIAIENMVGYIDTKGKMVIEPRFRLKHESSLYEDSDNWNFSEGLAAVIDFEKREYIDKSGQIVIPISARDHGRFRYGLARVELAYEKYAYINKKGQVLKNLAFNQAYDFSEGLAAVGLEYTMGFIDTAGTVVIKYQFPHPHPTNWELSSQEWCFSDGLAAVFINGNWGYIDKNGQLIIRPLYDKVKKFSEGLALVYENCKKTGFIDLLGRRNIEVSAPCRNLFYVDKTGQTIIDSYSLSFIDSFSEGFARVAMNSGNNVFGWGYIDKTGKMIISSQFNAANNFSEGLAAVQVGNKWGFINKLGQFIGSNTTTNTTTGPFAADIATVEKLTDQAMLADIAMKNTDLSVRKAAVEKLTDQALLAKVAQNAADWIVRRAAVEKLTDKALLEDIATKDSVLFVRKAAKSRLNWLQSRNP